MKVRRCELELFALFLSRHYFVASLCLNPKAQLLIYGLDFWQRQMRKRKTKCGRLSSVFFWHDKYMCKSVQKSSEKKVFQLKMDTMTFQNGMKKKQSRSFCFNSTFTLWYYIRSTRPIDARFHSSQNWQV